MLSLFLLSLIADEPQSKPVVKASQQATDSQDQVICRRFIETGSLVSSYKTCKTRREWDRERDNIRSTGPGINPCRDNGNGGAC